MADLIELRNRILAVHNGQLPPDAVNDDELRNAIAQLRDDRRKRASAPATSATSRTRSTTPAITLSGGRAGGLLDLMSQDD